MSAQTRYAAGDWYAVSGQQVIVVLPDGDRGRVAGLWELVDEGADADAVIDALLAGGLADLVFALVAPGGRTTRVIVRGAPRAVADTGEGEVRVEHEPGTAWAEALLREMSGLRLDLAGDGAAEHTLGPGIARVSAIEVGEAATGPQDASAATPSAVAPEPATEPEPEPEPEPELEPAPEPEPEPEPAPEPEPEPEPARASAVPPPAPVAPAPVAPGPVAPELAADQSMAPPLSFGEPADDPTPTGETPAVDWSDRDGQTSVGRPAPEFTRPPIPGQEIAPEVVSSPVASLILSTGDVIPVDRTVLIGRAPEARRFASHDQPHVVSVPSPNQEISSTHLEVRPGAGADHGSAIATDLGSTNGTVLAQPGLDPEELQPGIAVSLIPGAVLDLGDGVTIQVTNP